MTAAPLIGLVGAGRWGRNILSTIVRTGSLRLAWVASGNPETRALLPAGCELLADWQTATSRPSAAGVIVATPPATHAGIVEAFLGSVGAFFVEKPLTPDLKSTLALAERLRRQRCKLMVDHVHLFHPAFAALVQNLHRVGRLTAIRAEAGNWGPFRPDIGVLWDWGPHDAAMCLALLGEAPLKISAARTERRETEGGMGETIVIDANFKSCADAKIELSNLRRTKFRRFEARGGEGSLTYDPNATDALRFAPPGGDATPIPVASDMPLNRALERFAGLLSAGGGGGDGEIDLAVGVARFLDACERVLAAD